MLHSAWNAVSSWGWLWQLIPGAAAGGLVAFLTTLFALPAKSLEKRLGLSFDKRLEAFKGEQNKELARLQDRAANGTPMPLSC
jgi:flagellar biosynthesis protein FliR